ncbi:hypothetical protein I550_2761 [Mycobacterium intracellulare 1956]|uniref:Uncharacterized protein n=2 Tax=Mycobacterium intracellulare TaxID=1767 RepID=X8CVX2_MYCIT|nr:hypothetical protein OCU_27300 [Mycobacterium intracellulare ATCC 13950]ETZ35574.1 hypothetical protein L843_3003 [Mycobacterium intracellulare MIN_061107_1834]EUA27602.1 hypothetical protein I548_5711 [Mycobacterium intracellulare]EUA59613.1 hypothetical protein I550_2761 [Mycobacterium intracellulare 1956]
MARIRAFGDSESENSSSIKKVFWCPHRVAMRTPSKQYISTPTLPDGRIPGDLRH